MNRSIAVSTAVFAAIWANRQDGEESEDTILRRLLNCTTHKNSHEPKAESFAEGGVIDRRNNAHFPEGFEIFRTYKRLEYRATASQGYWVRQDTNQKFQTLNQLNESIAAGPENVWNGTWKFKEAGGQIASIDRLRDKVLQ